MAPNADGRITDRFDDYATTCNLIVVDDGRVVGGARCTQRDTLGMPPEEFYDFNGLGVAPSSRMGSASQFCLLQAYRNSRAAIYVMGMAHYWFKTQGLSHIICAINPEIQPLMTKVGYQALAPEQYDAAKGLAFVPMCLDMRDLCSSQYRFVKRQQGDVFYVSGATERLEVGYRKAA